MTTIELVTPTLASASITIAWVTWWLRKWQ